MSLPHEMSLPRGAAHRLRRRTDAPATGASFPISTIAEVLAEGTSHDPADLVVVCGHSEESVDLGLWPIPSDVAHPTDVLVGWCPPEWASVIGLITSGEARSADSIETVRVTVLAGANGQTATVLDRPGRPPETIEEGPLGWGADALSRCLGIPTPAPTVGLHTCVEATWLREVRSMVVEASTHGSSPNWEQVALVHPLHPPGWPAPPSHLRAATAALDLASGWGDVVRLMTSTGVERGVHPPGGEIVPLDQWFDEGSFARWSVRHLPEIDDALFEVLDLLPTAVGAALLDALVSTTSWQS